MKKQKRITLNAEKRNTIANVFQAHWEREDSPVMKAYYTAKDTYNTIRKDMKVLVEKIVRQHQPQEDIDTVRAMHNKYGRSGGELYHDNCFEFKYDYNEVDYDGNSRETYDSTTIDFDLDSHKFGYAYYRDELKAKGFNPDFRYQWQDEKRNPKYYECEEQCDKFLGYRNSSNEDKSQAIKPCAEWKTDFQLWVIGSSYCHSRQFKVDETTFKVLKQFEIAKDDLIQCHSNIYSYTENKMKKLRLGLKSYRYFDQAKSLADKLGVVLNESMMNESSSLALSVYSPENLASLLEDTVELTKDEKIAIARQQLQQAQQAIN